MISFSAVKAVTAFNGSQNTWHPAIFVAVLLITIFCLCGSGFPIDSKVLRPIIIGLFRVVCLKFLRSSARCHGSLSSIPIAQLLDAATIMLIFIKVYVPIQTNSNYNKEQLY